jgi:hypothetical protein
MSASQGPGSNLDNRFSGNFAAPGFDDIVQQTLRQYQTKSSQHSHDLESSPDEESMHFKQQQPLDLNDSKSDTRVASSLDSIVQNSILQYQDLAAKRSSNFDPNTRQDNKPGGDIALENKCQIEISPQKAPLNQNCAEPSIHQVPSDSDFAMNESSAKRQLLSQTERHQRSKLFKTAAGAMKGSPGAQTISDTGSFISGATLISDTGSATGSATSVGKALKADPSAAQAVAPLSAAAKKSSAKKSKGNLTEKQKELGRRRALSRISSSRSREREKQRLDYWRGEKEQLEQSSGKLMKENELLKELISKIKADISLRTIQTALVANLSGVVFK